MSYTAATYHQNWYALAVYARQEKAAAAEIRNLGVEVFLPMVGIRRLWSDRVKVLDSALFSGYLFVRTHLDAATRIRLLKPKQVIDVVAKKKDLGHEIAQAIPDLQIHALKLMLESREALEPVSRLIKGVEVKIVSGALTGVVGLIERGIDGQCRVVVQIPLLGRGVRVVVSANDVLALSELPRSDPDAILSKVA